MVNEVINVLGTIDILVNCGGITQHDPSEELPLQTWDHVIDVNLRGTFLCCSSSVVSCWRKARVA